jgi:hypothetical protein
MKKFENEYVSFTINNDILYAYYKKQTTLSIEAVKKIAEDRLFFTKGKSYLSLVDVTNIKSGSKSAREFLANPNKGLKGILAGAFLSDRVVSVVLINLFLKINKPSIPSKFFTNKDDAINWLKSLNV